MTGPQHGFRGYFTQPELDRLVKMNEQQRRTVEEVRSPSTTEVCQQPTLIPMPGRIVVEALKDEMTPSGLYLPTNSLAEQRATVGKIIALPGNVQWNEEYYVGDVVLFGINSGMNVDVGYGQGRRRAVILREGEILCKVVNAEGKPYA